MVGATRDSYLLIEEAVEDGLCVVDLLPKMDSRTKALALEFLVVLRAESRTLMAMPQMPWDASVLEHPSLVTTRAAASLCLEKLGFDLAKWEREL